MIGKTLLIKELTRKQDGSADESISLLPGANVVVGEPNTGKSKWLRTIDYLLGDDLSAPERTDPDDIFTKYHSAAALLIVSGEEVQVERRWTENRAMGKVFVNDEALALDEYRSTLMEKLSIPEVHYPQGNPYSPRSWPEVGWRSIMRHIYRRQKYWNDLADQQPEVEQHACLLQFLGVAD
jgi:hypothetical protein